MSGFPFDSWLRLAVSVYHLSPSEFWAMSVQDWTVLTSSQTAPFSRDDFAGLMKKFPDQGGQ